MSEGIIIAIVSVGGSILGAVIGALATVEAAKIKIKTEGLSTQSTVSCTTIGLVASVAGVIGLVLGGLFGTVIVQRIAVAPANIVDPGGVPSPPTRNPATDSVVLTTTRSEALAVYDSIYTQRGWCSLWGELLTDGLVTGNCPQAVNITTREDIVMNDGSTANLITGVQITINSDISVNHPACINYGIDGDYATLSGGRIQSWTTNSNIATDVTIKPNSIFSLYFRCDHIAWR